MDMSKLIPVFKRKPNIQKTRDDLTVLYVDVPNSCNLKCKTCPRGMGEMRNTQDIMDINLFKNIVKKGKKEGYKLAGLYNWTEPFLCRNLAEYVKSARKELEVSLSSNLSLKEIPHLEETLAAGVNHLIISVSGHTQEIHGINHAGSNLDIVKGHLQDISVMLKKRRIRTNIVLRLIKFSYNHMSEEPLRKYADSLGIGFEVIDGAGDPLRKINNDNKPDENINADPPCQLKTEIDFSAGICDLIANTMPVDHKGDAYLCCCHPNTENFLIGSYHDTEPDRLLALRYTHPSCKNCGWKRIPLIQKEEKAIREFNRTLSMPS